MGWTDQVIVPTGDFQRTVTRTLADLPVDKSPGAADVALVTAVREVQAKSFIPVAEALKRLEALQDWSGGFLVAEGGRFSWQTAPFKRYASFDEFYRTELKSTWGDWAKLKETYLKYEAGEISSTGAVSEIKTRASTAKNAARQTPLDVEPERGRPPENVEVRHLTQPARAAEAGISRHQQIKLDYIARERKDLKAKIEAQEISISAAFDEAKGKTKPTLVQRALTLVAKMTAEERDQFDVELRKV